MANPLIAANWKMNMNRADADAFAAALLAAELPAERDVLIAPPASLLAQLAEALRDSNVLVAAQHMHFEDSGAFTGELSPLHVKDTGATHVLIGHSERRQLFGETDEIVNKKMHAAARHGITPILCIGENEEERETGQAAKVVITQLQEALDRLENSFIENIVVAYEPVWAIGTGKTATALQAEGIQSVIREQLPASTRVLYGGSVKPENASELLKQPSVNGFLVGGASLKSDSFIEIINA